MKENCAYLHLYLLLPYAAAVFNRTGEFPSNSVNVQSFALYQTVGICLHAQGHTDVQKKRQLCSLKNGYTKALNVLHFRKNANRKNIKIRGEHPGWAGLTGLVHGCCHVMWDNTIFYRKWPFYCHMEKTYNFHRKRSKSCRACVPLLFKQP